MKTRAFLIAVAAFFLVAIAGGAWYLTQTPDLSQDLTAVNDILCCVRENWNNLSADVLPDGCDFTVTDAEGKVLFKTRAEGLSEDITSAIKNRDTVLSVVLNGRAAGRVIIHNDTLTAFNAGRRASAAVIISALTAIGLLLTGFIIYVSRSVLRPFDKLKRFAGRVAEGNLDLPLQMDKHNLFGAFTESFDLMRSQLKAAKEAAAEAERDKRELIVKLSHDIKTPLSSIKSAAELGAVTAAADEQKSGCLAIAAKAEQINRLITDLLEAELNELRELEVRTEVIDSREVTKLIRNADCLCKAKLSDPPDCMLMGDKLRLQQVFDNLLSNSYKYAGTAVTVGFTAADGKFIIRIEDGGGGVPDDDLPYVKEKFRRGKNAAGKEGAGLGLYICDSLVRAMDGAFTVENTAGGFAAVIALKLA